MKHKSKLLTVCRGLLLIFFILIIITLTRGRSASYENVNQYVTADVVYADGKTAHFEDKNFGEVSTGDVVTLYLDLPETPFFKNATLVFYDYNTVTQVWFEDTLLDSYGEAIAAQGAMIGNHDFLIDIPVDAWGGQLRIVLQVAEKRGFSNFTNLKIYPAKSAYRYFIDSDPLGFVVTLAFLAFAIMGLVVCIMNFSYGKALMHGVYLALTALLIALWMFTNKGIYSLFGLTGYFWQPLEYIAGYTIVIPLLLFFRSMTEKQSKWYKIFQVASLVQTAFFILSTILNFTNILHYDVLMDLAGILMVFSGLLLLLYSLRINPSDSKKQSLLRSGIFFFISTCLYEVVIRGIDKVLSVPFVYQLPSLLAVGALVMMVFMVAAYVEEISDRQKDYLMVQIQAEMLDKMIAMTPAGICQLKPGDKLTIVSANKMFYQILGYREEDLQQKGEKDLFATLLDEDKYFVQEKLQEILKKQETTGEYELNTVDINNQPMTLIIRYYYDREGSGNITVNVIDITERKQMEKELKISEERYRLALSQSGNVFFFFDVPSRTIHLSESLADTLGLPMEIDHMPDNPLLLALVDVEDQKNFIDFCQNIIAGKQSGDAVLACHILKKSQSTLWYKLSFVSVFDTEGKPVSTIINAEDMSEKHQAELDERWKQVNLSSIPAEKYAILTYDITSDCLLDQSGAFFPPIAAVDNSYTGICAYVLEHTIYPDDKTAMKEFLDLSRLLQQFNQGKKEEIIEYRLLRSPDVFRWTSLSVQMIEDPYSGHIMAQLLFRDIHEKKSGEIEMRQDMENMKQRLENSRIRVMINQMQPHFLYNALTAIQTIVKVDPDYAYQLIFDFTVHLRSSIKALSSDKPIPFADELKNIKAYLNIEKMRFGESLHIVYEIETEDFSVIPLSIQPLAENAARHGIHPKGAEGGTLWIRSYETTNSYVVEVEDNGAGFDVQEVMNRNSESIGLKNLIYRLKSLMDAEVVIKSELDKGTKVRVMIPKGACDLID